MEATQGALFRLERWSEYWCLPLNPNKCEASFFSVDPHQAKLHLLVSRLRFNPTPTFLGVTFDRNLSISKHVSSLKARFFPRLKALRCISASSWVPSKESLSVLYKSFLQPLLTYASPGWFLFLSVVNFTKLERLHRAASRAITGCLSSSPIPLLLSEASLPPLRVTLTHFNVSSYKRALRLPTSFPISSLARLGVKPRLCRSSWRAFASTHPLMLPSTFLLALPFLLGICLCSRCSLLFPLHAPALILLSFPKVRLSPTLTLPPPLSSGTLDWRLRSFSFWQGRLRHTCQLLFLWHLGDSFFFSRPSMLKFFRWSLRHSARSLLSRQHQQVRHFFSLLLLSYSRFVLATLSSPSSFLLLCGRSGKNCFLSPVLSGFNGSPDTRFSRGKTLAKRGALLAPSAIPCSLSLLISRIQVSNSNTKEPFVIIY